MIYPFVCDECGATDEVIRPASECRRNYICSCGADMRRVYTPVCGRIGMQERRVPVGCIDVGNEYTAMRSARPIERDYDISGADLAEYKTLDSLGG